MAWWWLALLVVLGLLLLPPIIRAYRGQSAFSAPWLHTVWSNLFHSFFFLQLAYLVILLLGALVYNVGLAPSPATLGATVAVTLPAGAVLMLPAGTDLAKGHGASRPCTGAQSVRQGTLSHSVLSPQHSSLVRVCGPADSLLQSERKPIEQGHRITWMTEPCCAT